MSTWAGFQLSIVDRAIDQWPKNTNPEFIHKEVTSNSCFDMACRIFHDCIKCFQSVTVPTSSYCCKLLNYDLQISQGSLVMVYGVLTSEG